MILWDLSDPFGRQNSCRRLRHSNEKTGKACCAAVSLIVVCIYSRSILSVFIFL